MQLSDNYIKSFHVVYLYPLGCMHFLHLHSMQLHQVYSPQKIMLHLPLLMVSHIPYIIISLITHGTLYVSHIFVKSCMILVKLKVSSSSIINAKNSLCTFYPPFDFLFIFSKITLTFVGVKFYCFLCICSCILNIFFFGSLLVVFSQILFINKSTITPSFNA